MRANDLGSANNFQHREALKHTLMLNHTFQTTHELETVVDILCDNADDVVTALFPFIQDINLKPRKMTNEI